MMTYGHCHKSGHEMVNCYQIVGFLEWWGKRSKIGNRAGVTGCGHGRSNRDRGSAGNGTSGGRGIVGCANSILDVDNSNNGASFFSLPVGSCGGAFVLGIPGMSNE